MADVDVVVIGSGAGGLNAALGCALAGKSVLVVEQHDRPGGWCHSFPLGGFEFSPGVHYIGDLDNGGLSQQLFEGLGVAKHLTFLELNRDGYDHVMLGDELRVDLPKGLPALRRRLKETFPHEANGIDSYHDVLAALRSELAGALSPPRHKRVLGSRRMAKAAHALGFPFRAPTLTRWGARPLASLLAAHITDPKLRAVLSIQCGNYGLPPSQTPCALHATVTGHYFDGGFYPKGGAMTLPRAYLRELKAHGGSIQLATEVSQILVENNRAMGVRLGDGTEVRANTVISNADPHLTYTKLLDVNTLPSKLRKKLGKTRYSLSNLSLFAAVDLDLEAMGFDSGNYWFNKDADVEGTYQRKLAGDLDAVDGLFVTITTLKDRSKLKGHTHTVEVFNITSTEPFKRFHGTYGKRSAEYEALKQQLMERTVAATNRVIPGFSDHLVFSEFGTPATNRHYVRSTDGNMYGTAKTLRQVGPFAYPVRSPVDGLFLCGSSTLSHGVAGAALSGVTAAARATKSRVADLLGHKDADLQIWQADDLSTWAERDRKRVEQRTATTTA